MLRRDKARAGVLIKCGRSRALDRRRPAARINGPRETSAMEPAKHGGVEGGAGRGATLRLVPAAAEEPQKARPVKLLASDSVEDAAVCVFSASLDHFEANL